MAVKMARIEGIDDIVKNLAKEIRGIKYRTKGGLRQAALLVQRRSVKLTPVKTSNLRKSAGTEVFGKLSGPTAEIYYTANYAVFVHERNLNYRKGQWKFLETALKESAAEIISIIKKHADIERSRLAKKTLSTLGRLVR